MKTQLLNSLKLFIFFTFILGVIYPLTVTVLAQSFFNYKANGSLIRQNGIILGSELIAQKTTSPRYFWPRPSASDFGAVPSAASNLSLTSEKLLAQVEERKQQGATKDLLFASASGLDPHISKDAALSQIARIVDSRKFGENQQKEVLSLVEAIAERRQFGFLGEERVNVLKLNMALDKAMEK